MDVVGEDENMAYGEELEGEEEIEEGGDEEGEEQAEREGVEVGDDEGEEEEGEVDEWDEYEDWEEELAWEFDDGDGDDGFIDLVDEYFLEEDGESEEHMGAPNVVLVVAENESVFRHQFPTSCSHHQCCDALASSGPEDEELIFVHDNMAVLYDFVNCRMLSVVRLGFRPYSIAKCGDLFAAGGDGLMQIFQIAFDPKHDQLVFVEICAVNIPPMSDDEERRSDTPMFNSVRFWECDDKVRLVVGNQDGAVYFFSIPVHVLKRVKTTPTKHSLSWPGPSSLRGSSSSLPSSSLAFLDPFLSARSAIPSASSSAPSPRDGEWKSRNSIPLQIPTAGLSAFCCRDQIYAGLGMQRSVNLRSQLNMLNRLQFVPEATAFTAHTCIFPGPVNFASVSPNGKWLAVVGDFEKIYILNVERNSPSKGMTVVCPFSASVDPLQEADPMSYQYLAWNGSSTLLAASSDSHSSVHVWSISDISPKKQTASTLETVSSLLNEESLRGSARAEENVDLTGNERGGVEAEDAFCDSGASHSAAACLSLLCSFGRFDNDIQGECISYGYGIRYPILALQFDPVVDTVLYFVNVSNVLHAVDIRHPRKTLQNVVLNYEYQVGPTKVFLGCPEGHKTEQECSSESCQLLPLWHWWTSPRQIISHSYEEGAQEEGGVRRESGVEGVLSAMQGRGGNEEVDEAEEERLSGGESFGEEAVEGEGGRRLLEGQEREGQERQEGQEGGEGRMEEGGRGGRESVVREIQVGEGSAGRGDVRPDSMYVNTRPLWREMPHVVRPNGLLVSARHGIFIASSSHTVQIKPLTRWSPWDHRHFPKKFKDVAKFLLLAASPLRQLRKDADLISYLPHEIALLIIMFSAYPLGSWV